MENGKAEELNFKIILLAFVAIVFRAIALFFALAALVYALWNWLLVNLLTIVKPMTSFWQAALLVLILEIIGFIVMYRIFAAKDLYKQL